MKSFIRIFLLLHYIVEGLGALRNLKEYPIQNNDRILILGTFTAFLGGVTPGGFINILKSESNSIFSNVSIFSGAEKNANSLDYTLELQNSYCPYYAPNKVMLIISFSELRSLNEEIDQSLSQLRFALETTVSYLTEVGIQVILCPIEIKSEFTDIVNESSNLITEEFLWLTKQIARDYEAMYIDLHNAMLKFQESTTIDNLPHSFLTQDGGILSDVGNAFVAQVLVERLLGSQSTFFGNNKAANEKRLIAKLRDTMQQTVVTPSGHSEL